jgi:hypothetical protein
MERAERARGPLVNEEQLIVRKAAYREWTDHRDVCDICSVWSLTGAIGAERLGCASGLALMLAYRQTMGLRVNMG